MKVLQLISSGGMYGAEAVVLNLARQLPPLGHRVVVGVFSNTSGGDLQLHREALAHGLDSHLLPCHGQFDRKMIARLRGFVAEHRFDVVHAHGYKADVYTLLSLRNAGIPLISTCHSWLDSNLKVRLYGIADRLVLRRFDAVISVSGEVSATLIRSGVPPANVLLIPNGIDPSRFERAAEAAGPRPRLATPRVGLVGRLEREKGIDLFLRAAAIVLEIQPEAQFVVAGGGPDRAALETLAGQLRITPNVTFLGRCETMPDLLATLDLVVSASRQEGLPVALLEAMASSRAIIATTVGEVPMLLDHGRAGLLVSPENVDALAQAVLTLLGDPAERNRLAYAAHDRVRSTFSAEAMTQRYLAVYNQAVTSKQQIHRSQDLGDKHHSEHPS